MIIVLGHVTVREEHFDEVLHMSLQHVQRSRAEPGCLAHAVHRDEERPLRLVFVEKWSDMAALQAHFRVPASREFGNLLAAAAAQAPVLEIYQAAAVKPA